MKDKKYLILIADDEKEIRDVLAILLTSNGYSVLIAEDGQDVIEQSAPEIDLYLLDVNMPRISGIAAALDIRKHYDTPIIFLTAYSSESDKVMGFSVGADDYVVKPFSSAELLYRIKAILRRQASHSAQFEPPKTANRITFHDAELDLDSQSILRNGETIPLTYTEFKILELLAGHKKKIYSLDNIYQSIWGDNAVGDSAIMVHIKNIRKKLGDNSRSPTYIKTAWGRGYYID